MNIKIPMLETECKCRQCKYNDIASGHWCIKKDDRWPDKRRWPGMCLYNPRKELK